jgi:DNA excision repair protein ERCC-4
MRRSIEITDITCVIDTREQQPLALETYLPRVQRGTLETGDYSVLGLEHLIAIERKSLSDLVACCGVERERFERELRRMAGYETKCLVVEASWRDLEAGMWRSKLSPAAAVGSVLSWIAEGIPVIMAGSREAAAHHVARILYIAARRRWRELLTFLDAQLPVQTASSPFATA